MKTKINNWVLMIGIGMALILGSASSAKADSSFGQWETFPTFTGLDFRAKKCSFNQSANKWEWQVEFRNRYEKTINFSFKLDEDGTTRSTLTDRTTLKAGGEGKSMGDSGTTWKLLTSSNRIEVFVGKVRFGDDDNGPYVTHN